MNLIVIDAGHGGKDGGAYGKRSKESDIALSVSRKIKNILEPYLTAKLTRAADVFLPLNERPRRANLWGATAFISIHCNASDNKAARGWEVFTTKGQNNSDKLATCTAKRYRAAFPGLKLRADWIDRDIDKEANHAVTRGTNCPSCLFELGFISNEEEEKLLNCEEYQDQAAKAIAFGILDFCGIVPCEEKEQKVEALTVEQRLERLERKVGL